ncbi:hypothetical protein [Arthrobacter sp. zg-Y1143]|uniref:hypothetical protein n=1 Tax=Arthrobacter sp. zg-Y1143 TaxID=3049065 RepID=UPI0024C2C78D|nr:hypothetical protein [Arthrobacter sp. zg-Y1143]MDK1329070.1 hypothetical protein [Arthrobacter sp. zg-Y1143]
MNMKSVRKLGTASSILFAGAAMLGLLGLVGPAVAALSAASLCLLAVMYVLEQRRGLAHREQMRELRRLNQVVAKDTAAQQKSTGLLFREVRLLTSELCSDNSLIIRESEKAVSIHLHALRLAKAEIMESVEVRGADLALGSK